MRHLFNILKSSVWLALLASLTMQTAHAAQTAQYPPADEPWDGASYRALIQRVEDRGLALPTLSNAATKPVFERMVATDNIPLHMGLNRELSITVRFQRLDSALDPIHKLAVLYSIETQKGKPYAREHASLMVYETKVCAALLDVSDGYLATLTSDKRYQLHVSYLEKVRSDARQFYTGLVYGATDTQRYSKADSLKMIRGALTALPSYHAILTDEDRKQITGKLTEQISTTADQQMKTALTELRDTLEHRRIPT